MPRNWASFSPFSLPVIALRVKDTIVRALVDTGASQSLVDPSLVKQLDLPEGGTALIVGIGTSPSKCLWSLWMVLRLGAAS